MSDDCTYLSALRSLAGATIPAQISPERRAQIDALRDQADALHLALLCEAIEGRTTVADAAEALGCSTRSLWRAGERDPRVAAALRTVASRASVRRAPYPTVK